jgi:invasion protein IalB
VKQTSRSTGSTPRIRRNPAVRLGAAVASAGLLVGLAACGFNAQTLQPYDPADGVNPGVGNPNQQPNERTKVEPNTAVKVRGLMIIAKTPTSGFLSATIYSDNADQLTSVTGNVLQPNDAQGAALTVTLPSPVQIPAGAPVVLVDQQAIDVTASRLPAGQTANLTLTFAKAGSKTVQVPIVDGQNDTYRTVQPSAAPSSGATSQG